MHWRAFLDSEVIRYADLADKGDVTLTIKSVKRGKVTGRSAKSTSKAMISFEGAERPLAAGTAILSTIARLYSSDTRKWVGKQITIYADHDVMFGSEKVGGVRVRDQVPKVSSPSGQKETA